MCTCIHQALLGSYISERSHCLGSLLRGEASPALTTDSGPSSVAPERAFTRSAIEWKSPSLQLRDRITDLQNAFGQLVSSSKRHKGQPEALPQASLTPISPRFIQGLCEHHRMADEIRRLFPKYHIPLEGSRHYLEDQVENES